jgi:hypothetical protein
LTPISADTGAVSPVAGATAGAPASLSPADVSGLQSQLNLAGGGTNNLGAVTTSTDSYSPTGAANLVNADGSFNLPPPDPGSALSGATATGSDSGLSGGASGGTTVGGGISAGGVYTAPTPGGTAQFGSQYSPGSAVNNPALAGAVTSAGTSGVPTGAAGSGPAAGGNLSGGIIGGSSGGGSLGGTGSIIGDLGSGNFSGAVGDIGADLAKNPSLALTGALLGYDALRGNQTPKGENAISATATQLGAQATQLESYLTNGTLPPGAQTALNQAAQQASAAIRSQYAARGESGSSAELADLANVQNTITSQGVSIATNLLNQGVSEAGLASQLYGQILNTSLSQDNQLSTALATLAAASARPTTVTIGSAAAA